MERSMLIVTTYVVHYSIFNYTADALLLICLRMWASPPTISKKQTLHLHYINWLPSALTTFTSHMHAASPFSFACALIHYCRSSLNQKINFQLVYFSSRFSSSVIVVVVVVSVIILCECVSFINCIDCRFVDFIKYISPDDWMSVYAIRFAITYYCRAWTNWVFASLLSDSSRLIIITSFHFTSLHSIVIDSCLFQTHMAHVCTSEVLSGEWIFRFLAVCLCEFFCKLY